MGAAKMFTAAILLAAHQNGGLDRIAQVPRKDNPYSAEDERAAWDAGWKYADLKLGSTCADFGKSIVGQSPGERG